MIPTAPTQMLRPERRRRPRWHMIAEIELAPLIVEQTGWLRLCDELEAIADALPQCPGAAENARIAAQIEGLVEAPAELPEPRPPISSLAEGAGATLADSLFAHVRAMRAARIVQAQDIVDALDGDPSRQPDLLGYMLRCFFESCRHLITIEQLTLLAVGGTRLLPGARALLTERLTRGHGAG